MCVLGVYISIYCLLPIAYCYRSLLGYRWKVIIGAMEASLSFPSEMRRNSDSFTRHTRSVARGILTEPCRVQYIGYI